MGLISRVSSRTYRKNTISRLLNSLLFKNPGKWVEIKAVQTQKFWKQPTFDILHQSAVYTIIGFSGYLSLAIIQQLYFRMVSQHERIDEEFDKIEATRAQFKISEK